MQERVCAGAARRADYIDDIFPPNRGPSLRRLLILVLLLIVVPIGLYASLSGYLDMTIGWVEGVEINFLGAVLGIDVRRPALKLPGLGRLGLPAGL